MRMAQRGRAATLGRFLLLALISRHSAQNVFADLRARTLLSVALVWKSELCLLRLPIALPLLPGLRPCSTPGSSVVFQRRAAIVRSFQMRGRFLSAQLPAGRPPSARLP